MVPACLYRKYVVHPHIYLPVFPSPLASQRISEKPIYQSESWFLYDSNVYHAVWLPRKESRTHAKSIVYILGRFFSTASGT